MPHYATKVRVYLEDEDARRLAMLAELEGESEAEVLRKVIRSYVPRRGGPRRFALDGVGEGSGGSVADVDEGMLLKGFGD